MNILICTTIPIPKLEKKYNIRYYDMATDSIPAFRAYTQNAQLVIEQEINDPRYRLSHYMDWTSPYTATAYWDFDSYLKACEREFYVKHFDHVFCSALNMMDVWDSPTTFLPMCANDAPGTNGYTCNLNQERIIDIGFCGYRGYFKPKRNTILDACIKHFGNCRFADTAQLWGERYNEFYNQVKIAWNCSPTESVNFRVFETMRAGCLTITDRNQDAIYLFGTDDKYVLLYDDAKECIDKTEYYLSNWDKGEEIARAGYELVEQKHLRSHRYERIIELMQERGLVAREAEI